MGIREWIPDAVVDYIRRLHLKLRYPGRQFRTSRVGRNVSIGIECKLLKDVEIGNNVSIGDYTYVNEGTVIASGKIGRFCSIGYRCQIGMPEHPTDYISTSSRFYSQRNIFGRKPYWNDFPSPPVIGNDVWIGSGAIVNQGVTIGDGSIIAAGGIVTKSVEPYNIVGGVPARIIRKRFTDDVIAYLLDIKWWEWPLEKILDFEKVFAAGSNWKEEITPTKCGLRIAECGIYI